MSGRNRLAVPVVTGLMALALMVGTGCSSKSSSPTSPGGGGGGVESFASGNFTNSNTQGFVHTFNTAGDYVYYCSIHGSPTGGMRGTIHVASGSPESVTVDLADFVFTPSPANVKPGGYVHWVSGTTTTHNVTR